MSRVGGKNIDPQQFPDSQQPWATWWSHKRLMDERLWAAAESGSRHQLQDALVSPTDGNAAAGVNSRSLYGRRALHISASVGNVDCVLILLDASADLGAHTDAGLTALHIASQRGHFRVASLLLDWGSNVLAETNDHNLPVHMAAASGNTDLVALLLEHGGNTFCEQLRTRNSLGQRPSEASLDIKTAELFRKFESSVSTPGGSAFKQSGYIMDHYAGRTPSHWGTVLPHNARADIVHRVLHKMRHSQNLHDIELPEERSFKESASPSKVRGPFARISANDTIREEVGPDAFVFVEKIGRGSFGEVHQVRHIRTSQVYAMKIIRKNRVMSGNLLRYTVTERNVLSYLRHPYIVSLYFAFQTPHYLVLVMQYCPGGNLQHLIDKEGKLREPLARLYTAEILVALGHLHKRQIVYRDLKPENIVLDEVGHSVLTDFGLSKEGVMNLKGTRSFCGSVAFLAPEILSRRGHCHTVDIYGLGVLLFDMLTGLPPFWHPDRETLFSNIQHAQLRVPRFVSRPASSLIESLMDREPAQRLGANCTFDVQEHRFFVAIDFEALMERTVPVPVYQSNYRGVVSSSPDKVHAGKAENPLSAMSREARREAKEAKGQVVSGWSFAAA